MIKNKKVFLTSLFLFWFFGFELVFSQNPVELYLFWGWGCPHCAAERPFLENLKKKYPQLVVKEFEVYFNSNNRRLFSDMAKAYNTSVTGVPMTFIGKNVLVGFNTQETTGKEIENLVKQCLSQKCPSPAEILAVGGIDQWEKLQTISVLSVSTSSIANTPNNLTSKITIHYFMKEHCSQCQEIFDLLKNLAKKYQIDVTSYDISQLEDKKLYEKLQEFYGISFSDFPIVFLGENYLMGSLAIKENIEKLIIYSQTTDHQDLVLKIKETLESKSVNNTPLPTNTTLPEEKEMLQLSLLGKKIKISTKTSLFFLAIILGLVDGINPCMFSVLLFLLTYLLAIGSRKKAIRAGLVFTLGAFITYFLFMVGMISVISLMGFISKIKLVIALFAFIAGIIMVKDFFAYGKGISLEIPQTVKPLIERLVKKASVPSAFLLALLSSLVELPCTAGIPLVYTSLLAQRHIFYLPFLLLYNFFFVLPLLIIILLVTIAWTRIEKVEKWRLAFRRYMRLLAGIILLLLAIALFKNFL